MLMWHRAPWLIDHGSSLYFHHAPGWEGDPARPRGPFPAIRQHVLLHLASRLAEADAALSEILTPAVVDEVLALLPDAWAIDPAPYRRYLRARLEAPRVFVEEAADAR
jgi:hypothetical protein